MTDVEVRMRMGSERETEASEQSEHDGHLIPETEAAREQRQAASREPVGRRARL